MTSMSILCDSMLKAVTCSECDNYLSVLPVKIYPNRVVKCGRCCKETDNGTESMYNRLVGKCVFKCANRYEGCNKLLTVSEVKEHERQCINGNYLCPKCEHRFSGSANQLLAHYTKHHPKSILYGDNFVIKAKLNFRERYLYLFKDFIFFVLVDNLSREKTLYLSTVSLIKFKNARQSFSIKPLYQKTDCFSTKLKPCHSLENFESDYFKISTHSMRAVSCRVYLDLSDEIRIINQLSNTPKDVTIKTTDISNADLSQIAQNDNSIKVSTCCQTVQLKDILGVNLTGEFRKEYPEYELTPCGTALFRDNDRTELACSNCKQLTGCNVFNCQLNKHVVCWDCKAWCGICNGPINGWNAQIATINEFLQLPCRWKCGKYFSGNYIHQHELSCEKYKCKCPLCQNEYLSLEKVCDHLVLMHRNYKNVTHFNLVGYLRDKHNQPKDEVCFYQNGYWFRLYWVKKQNMYEVLVETFDKIDLYELVIVCDSDKSFNKIGNEAITFALSDNPRFYLKRICNL